MARNSKRNKKTEDRKRLYVYIPEEQKELLKDLSEEEQKSVSAIVSELIDEKLKMVIKLDLKFKKEE